MLHLDNMRPGEKVEMVIRRHWIALAVIGVYFLIIIKISIISLIIIGFTSFYFILMICFWLASLVFLYIEWINYELDLFIVTNNRIVGVDQISFLNRTVTECNLGQVQEVNSQTKGILANIFNYGTIDIQTAGATTTLMMGLAPEALEKSRLILNIVDEYRDSYHNHNSDLSGIKNTEDDTKLS